MGTDHSGYRKSRHRSGGWQRRLRSQVVSARIAQVMQGVLPNEAWRGRPALKRHAPDPVAERRKRKIGNSRTEQGLLTPSASQTSTPAAVIR